MKIPKPVRPKSQTINERLNSRSGKFQMEVMRQAIISRKNVKRDSEMTPKEQVAKIYWEASDNFEHHGKEYIEIFRQTFLELCHEDGIKW